MDIPSSDARETSGLAKGNEKKSGEAEYVTLYLEPQIKGLDRLASKSNRI